MCLQCYTRTTGLTDTLLSVTTVRQCNMEKDNYPQTKQNKAEELAQYGTKGRKGVYSTPALTKCLAITQFQS